MVVPISHTSKSVQPVSNCSGFTLVELLMVMSIIAILATMAITSIADFKDKTRTARAAAEIRGIEKDIFAFAADRGIFPDGLIDIGWENRFDPWGSPYVYLRSDVTPPAARTFGGDPINTDFDLYSKGSDKLTTASITTSDDDIIRAGNGVYVGTALNYGP